MLIKDLIHIPERVQEGDFVLKLTEGVQRSEETVQPYVVTPQIRDCFDDALGLIRDALKSKASKASYLHGSFGSGKSHFMAILHLLLTRDPGARSIRELGPIIAVHDEWIGSNKLLLMPIHMLNMPDMETAVLGSYAEQIRHLHPNAPIPGVYRSEYLFRDAAQLREQMKDAAFFEALNARTHSETDDEWGDLGSHWDAEEFQRALHAQPGSEAHDNLVNDLITAFFSSYSRVASREEYFISLDQGLSIISMHASKLGYSGMVFFLDELILWLASHVSDSAFLSREIPKITALVESQHARRPVPLISFLARQRDLRELVGDHLPGAEQQSFLDTLKWSKGRFHTITLEDFNLAEIAEKRVLRTKSVAARQELDAAFRKKMDGLGEDVARVLLTQTGDQAMFGKVYPFTPALVQALVALSSVLQRHRTALKVMLQLLVRHRHTLTQDQIVPMGDVFDVLAEGAEPFSSEMRNHFQNAVKLYETKLRPALEHTISPSEELPAHLPEEDPRKQALRADDRIVKTLLLAALVPDVPCFQNMTANRLNALNHGVVHSPIRGQEAQMILSKCRQWAAQVGEIKISDDAINPTIAIQITGVDTETIIEKARSLDNLGGRQRKIREILFQQLGVVDQETLLTLNHTITWRGTRRSVEVHFGNIRQMADEMLRSNSATWRIVLDFPFDEANHSPSDDVARLERFQHDRDSTRSLCWLPHFLSRKAQKDLGILVILEHILASDEQFRSYSNHLSEVERGSARQLLDNRRSQLKASLQAALECAYGVSHIGSNLLDDANTVQEHFVSLEPAFDPQPPVGANLRECFLHLLDQCFSFLYPAHPQFETSFTVTQLRKVLDQALRALPCDQYRLVVDKPLRPLLRQIANPLKLGEMHESAFILGQTWKNLFERKIADLQKKGTSHGVSVKQMRAWMDEPKPTGLTREVQNLLILVFAQQTNRVFRVHGATYAPTLEQMDDDAELHTQDLPSQRDWEEAVERAGALFGLVPSKLLNANNVDQLVQDIAGHVKSHQQTCFTLVKALDEVFSSMNLNANAADRMIDARAASELLGRLDKTRALDVIHSLVKFSFPKTPQSLGACIKKAADICHGIEETNWKLIESLCGLEGPEKGKAEAILNDLRQALQNDEFSQSLRGELRRAENRATDLITSLTRQSTPPTPPKPVAPVQASKEENRRDLTLNQAKSLIQDLERTSQHDHSLRLDITWRKK